jgi:hypothetical protein
LRPKTPYPGGLPPLPIPPGPSSAGKPSFDSEPPTREKNVTASIFQSLLSVFDEMSSQQRMEFVDFASRYASLDAGGRQDLLELVSHYSTLRPEDRAALLALAVERSPRTGR